MSGPTPMRSAADKPHNPSSFPGQCRWIPNCEDAAPPRCAPVCKATCCAFCAVRYSNSARASGGTCSACYAFCACYLVCTCYTRCARSTRFQTLTCNTVGHKSAPPARNVQMVAKGIFFVMALAAAHAWCEHHQKLLGVRRLGGPEGFTMGDANVRRPVATRFEHGVDFGLLVHKSPFMADQRDPLVLSNYIFELLQVNPGVAGFLIQVHPKDVDAVLSPSPPMPRRVRRRRRPF